MNNFSLLSAEEAVLAPEWSVNSWFNIDHDLRLADLRGRVVVLHAFQMLCPGCVSHGIPQALRVRATFAPEDVIVVGMHSVFEHHDAMRPVSLEAFLHEYRVDIPVAVDSAVPGMAAPATLQAYRMRGTPTLILIDGRGRLRLQSCGRPDDMAVGAAIASLVAENRGFDEAVNPVDGDATTTSDGACTTDGCEI
jgi:hypothetical protein